MPDSKLLLEKNAAIATITFNSPKTLNALTVETFAGLQELFDELETDADIRVIILTGAGDKAFVAGGDISHLASLDANGAREFALLAQQVIDRIPLVPRIPAEPDLRAWLPYRRPQQAQGGRAKGLRLLTPCPVKAFQRLEEPII